MSRTLNALLSRNISYVVAHNLVLAKWTLGKLAKLDNETLKTLRLEEDDIAAIRDGRPSIPQQTLNRLFECSWRTCCVCHKRELPIVVHHIKEWSNGGTHHEDNLAVLCLVHHHKAHVSGGTAKDRLSASEIMDAKNRWAVRAAKIRDAYSKALLSPHHRGARWIWIHFDRLRAMTSKWSSADFFPMATRSQFLIDKGFIDSTGHIAPEAKWVEDLHKPKKHYLFDSGNGQEMVTYLSDILGRLILGSGVLDVTDMLDSKDCLQAYVKIGMLVFFRSQIEISRNPDGYPTDGEWLRGAVNTTDVRVSFVFCLWTSLNMTSKGTHLPAEAERSIFGEVTAIEHVGEKVRVTITPLGISTDFLLHDPSQGSWVKGADNSEFKKRRKRAKAS